MHPAENYKFQILNYTWASVSLALLALLAAGCAAPPAVRGPLDPGVPAISAKAQRLYRAGDAARAADVYAQALGRARASDDAPEIARSAYNLAACRMAAPASGGTEALLDEASIEARRAGMETAPIQLLQAELARRAGAAGRAADLAAPVCASRHDGFAAQALLIQAEAACDRTNFTQAAGLRAQAERRLARCHDPVLSAGDDALAARLAQAQGHPLEAAAALERRAGHLQAAGDYLSMARALGQAAQAWQQAGRPAQAADDYYRAARSLWAQQRTAEAVPWVGCAAEMAQNAGDAALVRRVTRLFEDIKKSAEIP